MNKASNLLKTRKAFIKQQMENPTGHEEIMNRIQDERKVKKDIKRKAREKDAQNREHARNVKAQARVVLESVGVTVQGRRMKDVLRQLASVWESIDDAKKEELKQLDSRIK